MPTTPPLDKALVPAANALLLCTLAREHGLDTSALLAQAGINEAHLSNPAQWLSVRQCTHLMALVQAQTGLEGLGYELGLRTPATAHGLFGLGLLSCGTPAQALALATRYVRLRNPTFGMRWAAQDGWVVVSLDDLMPQAPMRQMATQWVLLSMLRMGETLLGPGNSPHRADCELSWPWPQPPWHAAYAGRLPPCHFNAAHASLHFPASWLTRPLEGAAPATLQLAQQACEGELALRAPSAGLSVRVRALLEAGHTANTGYPAREAVAAQLAMSLSTLKRQLAQEGASFSTLLDEVRLRQAQHLLEHATLTVQDVAARLGYQNTANFSRAFKQWTGQTPSAWRARP